MDAEQAAHHSHRKPLLMLCNERVLHYASLAKDAVAFFKYVALLGDARQLLFELPDLVGLVAALIARHGGELLLPFIKRMLADTQPLRNLRNRITPFRDLTHRVTLKLFAEIRFAHGDLLTSKSGKKVSTKLGAIQGAFGLIAFGLDLWRLSR
jgi:hypothetical protein